MTARLYTHECPCLGEVLRVCTHLHKLCTTIEESAWVVDVLNYFHGAYNVKRCWTAFCEKVFD